MIGVVATIETTLALYRRKFESPSPVMNSISKGTKFAIIFGTIGIAVGIGVTLLVVNNQTGGLVFQRAVEDDDNPWNDPAFMQKYNEKLRIGSYYKTRLAVGQEGFFFSDARGGKEPYTFEWRFSDGVNLQGNNATRSFDSVGKYSFDLIVTDSEGKQGKSTDMYVEVLKELPEVETTNSTLTQGH